MRISKGRGWLAAVSLILGTANGDYVTFTTGFEDGAVLSLDNTTTGSRTFGWTVKTGFKIIVNEVRLMSFTPGIQGERELASGKNSPPIQFSQFQQSSRLEVYANETGGHVKFLNGDLSWFDFKPSESLFFEAKWNDGSSYSRAFIILPAGVLPANAIIYTISKPHKAETGAPPVTPTEDGQEPGSTGIIVEESSSNPTTQPADPSPSGGLAQGAVIGIAVACSAIGLLLVCGLVWYLLRRRQQNKAMHPGPAYGSGNRADELMAEKEAAADVDVSPHSPYSDDGARGAGPSGTYQNGAVHGDSVAAGAAAVEAAAHPRSLQDAPRSFTPYSDRPGAAAAGTPGVRAASVAPTDEPQVSVPSATPGRATPRALATPIAHLVEEGMTEEEIRRLEEEERQLDAAIEQAGRR
ncbi:hypothetical protein N657DRAFT_667635 [Parathielavia appendiculata]|uniref:Uncharacterized protein n=1 Tax=Parathielavia appendiculata TaxID=2587402 RepID=A0AAN6U910_9PEZI|nr:hypothetical protein N657DRAFT_667635 [Parathielavia appendiculata]